MPFFLARFVLGALSSFIYPSVHDLISRWSPPDEKGKLDFAMLGGNFGTIVTWSMTDFIIDLLDWKCAFYVCVMISLILSIFRFCFAADSLAKHSGISKSELEYILSSLGDSVSKNCNQPLPVLDILNSVPFMVLLILHFGNLFGLFFLITVTPRFMTEVLGSKIVHARCISSLPYLMRMFLRISDQMD